MSEHESTIPHVSGSAGGPERIGPYRIREVLGEGGMGTVYLAEQTEPVKRKVALKIIKLGMDTKEVIARFESERQALALMNHPNVAGVLDAGATEQGRPYFVMEYVPGEPITVFCDKHQLSLPERLNLFMQVCHAIQHAHQKGIIHRDIKPSNVLVMYQDGKPVPKVIDFGVAKATNQRLTEKTVFTEQGVLIGTPEYMSPEQAEMTTLDIDTRTDVYSLGVLLYEMLTGMLPFDPKSLRSAGFAGMVRIIREVEPSKPSTKLSSLLAVDDPSGSHVAEQRRLAPRTLMRRLRGDLDWVTMKALEKDRTRRYDSASDLAADIQRHLRNEPVVAGPPSAAYKMSKFVRRNKAAVSAAAVVLIVLIGGISGTTVGFIRATVAHQEAETARDAEAAQRRIAVAAEQEQNRARQQAEQARAVEEEQRKLAEQQRDRAEKIKEFVTKALVSSDPNQAGAQGFLVTDAMKQAVALLDAGELKDQPEMEAGLLLTISGILNGNAQSVEALRLARRALEINEQLHPGDHRDVAMCLNNMAGCMDVLGRSAEALPNYEAALEMTQRLFEGDHRDVATSLNNVAFCLRSLGRSAKALPKFEAALQMNQRLFEGDHRDVAGSLNNLAFCLGSLGRSAEALPKYEAALEMRQRLFEGDHPAVAGSLGNVAACMRSLGRLAEALPKYHVALEMSQRLFEGDHPAVAGNLNGVAFCLNSLGRSAEALPKFEEALRMTQRLFEGDHPDVATGLNNVAACLNSLGRSAEALPKFEAALQMTRRLFEGDHPTVARGLNNVATCLVSLGRSADALPKFEAALQIRQRLSKGGNPAVATSLNNVAGCLRYLGRSAEALPKYEAALEMSQRILPPGHPRTLYPQLGLARTLVSLGRHAEAEALLLDAAEQCERSEVSRRMLGRSVINASVRLYDSWHAAEPGKGYDEKAAEWRAKLQPADLAKYLIKRGLKLAEEGKHADAEPLLRECLKIRRGILAEDHWLIFNTMSVLGAALAGQEKSAEAQPLLIEGYEKMKPPPARLNRKQEALERIVALYDAWHAAESDKGYDAKAAEWRAKRAESQASTQPVTQPTSPSAP